MVIKQKMWRPESKEQKKQSESITYLKIFYFSPL